MGCDLCRQVIGNIKFNRSERCLQPDIAFAAYFLLQNIFDGYTAVLIVDDYIAVDLIHVDRPERCVHIDIAVDDFSFNRRMLVFNIEVAVDIYCCDLAETGLYRCVIANIFYIYLAVTVTDC